MRESSQHLWPGPAVQLTEPYRGHVHICASARNAVDPHGMIARLDWERHRVSMTRAGPGQKMPWLLLRMLVLSEDRMSLQLILAFYG